MFHTFQVNGMFYYKDMEKIKASLLGQQSWGDTYPK
jgi:hypothetical protein